MYGQHRRHLQGSSNNFKMEKLLVVKIGGNVIDDENALHAFLKKFASIGERKILVHGGGKVATQIGDQLGIASKYIDGRRITDDATIDLVTMVYGGLINKKMVAVLQSLSCNAIGITGADANLLPATRRPVVTHDFGWVGDLQWKNIPARNWQVLIENNFIPVVAPLTHDQQGHVLNTNADTMAANIAMVLSSCFQTRLIYCFEKNGILADMGDENAVLPLLNERQYLSLKQEKKLFAGILPKLENAFLALHHHVTDVVIGNADKLEELINGSGGTRIRL